MPTIRTYQQPNNYTQSIESSDGSWIVFVTTSGESQLWRRAESGDFEPA